MGRRQSAAILERKYQQAKKREEILKAKTPSNSTTVNRRKTDSYIYNSYSLTDAQGNSNQYLVQASEAAVTKFGGKSALGLVDPATVALAISQKPKTLTPAKVSAMVASATPTAKLTDWGSRVIKYSAATGGTQQAHFTAPISGDTNGTYKELAAKASSIYSTIKGSLGDEESHRYWFSPEIVNIQEN
jgi:hypothetical protein